jgi:hypothetical protein
MSKAPKRSLVRDAVATFVAAADKKSIAAWLTVLGAALFVVLRFVSDLFYAPLGLSPEDIGLDQVRLLATTTGMLLFTLLLLAMLLPVFALFGRKLLWKHRWYVAAGAVALFVGLLVTFALVAREDVFAGHSISAASRVFLPWDATVVQVRWIGGEQPPQDLDGLPCAMFLGSWEGVTFLVDPGNDRTLRVPTPDVVVSTPRGSGVTGCGPEGPSPAE